MKWKCEVEITASIDLFWDTLLNREFVINDRRGRYFVTMTKVIKYNEYRVIHCSYVFNNVYVVSEYFELRKLGDATILEYYGSCSSISFMVLSKLKFSGLFNGNYKYDKFCQRIKSFVNNKMSLLLTESLEVE
jgi:hypothetical protein